MANAQTLKTVLYRLPMDEELKTVLLEMINWLEALESAQQVAASQESQPAPTLSDSSAPTTGPAERLYESQDANLDWLQAHTRKAITDYFRSIQFTVPECKATWPDSSTLQLTLRWPTPSTKTTTDGDLGHANPNYTTKDWQRAQESVERHRPSVRDEG